jgi:23S rRNA pseudouridine2457 synthase
MLIALNKPYGTLCQFTAADGHSCLADFAPVPGVYPAGRLDADSEGLVMLTDDGALQARIADPRHKLVKVYWVQVEGVPDQAALRMLREGVELSDGRTRPASVRAISTAGAVFIAATTVTKKGGAERPDAPPTRVKFPRVLC